MATVLFWWGVINYPGMVLLPLANNKTRGRALFTYINVLIGGVGFSAYGLHEWFPKFQPPSWTNTWTWWAFGWTCVIIGIIVVIKKPSKKQFNAA